MIRNSKLTLNSAFTREYFEIIRSLDGDVQSRKDAFKFMQNSSAIVHHEVIASSFVPKFYDERTYACMKRTSEMAWSILCKVMQRYLDCPEYRTVFDFDERLVELILLPRGYDSLLPFARVDAFIDEDNLSVRFCEFNGDGSSGMNENREITNSLVGAGGAGASAADAADAQGETAKTLRIFAENHTLSGCDLFSAWVDKFIEIYNSYEHRVDSPHFAICDYLENGVVDEFHIFAELFKQAGYECSVCDVRELTFDGEALRSKDGTQIDAIWRRCVTNDVLEYWDESRALIEAVRAEKVALIGSFAGHIVHDKQIFNVLFKPETKAFLTEDEIAFIEQTVPFTAFLDSSEVDLNEIRTSKDSWIIKPTDHYGSDNVYAGCECTQDMWESLIEKFADSRAGYPFLVQHFIKPHKTEILPADFGILEAPETEVPSLPQMYNNLSGLYLYDGVFTGVFSRLGPNPTISKPNAGITAATIWVDTPAPAQDGVGISLNGEWRASAGLGEFAAHEKA